MVRVFMTGEALPVVIRTAGEGDSVVYGESDTLKVISEEDGVFLFRWSAVDYVESTEDE